MAIITHDPVPAPFTPDPNESRPSHKKRWLAAGVGGLAIGAMLWGGSKLGATTYTVENNLSSDKGTEAPAIPGEVQESSTYLDPSTTDPEVFADQSYESILNETVPILEKSRETSLAAIDEYFNRIGSPSLPKREQIENPTPENMAAQDIERNISADIRTITEISITNPTLAKNLARAVFKDPTTYQVFIDGLNDKKHFTRTSVVAVSPELPSMTIGAHSFTEPSFVLLNTNMDEVIPGTDSSPIFNRVVSRYSYENGKTHYAITLQMQSDNPNFIDYPENIVPAQG